MKINETLGLFTVNGLAMVNTVSVGIIFEIPAKTINRKIRNKIKDLKEVMTDRAIEEFFVDGNYIDKQKQTRPTINMTELGFNLIVMGFTGKEAVEFQVEYVKAFAVMKSIIITEGLEATFNLEMEQAMTDLMSVETDYSDAINNYSDIVNEVVNFSDEYDRMCEDNVELYTNEELEGNPLAVGLNTLVRTFISSALPEENKEF